MKKSMIFSILLLVSILISVSVSQSKGIENKIYVDCDETEEYTSIQTAIDNASDESDIYVKSGTYIEDIIVNKTLNIIGENNNNTNISGCFHILADGVTIKNFKIDSSKNPKKTLEYGIEVLSNSSTITNNIMYNNTIGIFISEFDDNSIYHNSFINNTLQADDNGNNTWFNKKFQQGNYWDDYKGIDQNNDGIGDNPYNITDSEIQDKYPLMMPYNEFMKINERGFNLDELAYVLTIGVVLSVVFLVPIAYYFRKKILKL